MLKQISHNLETGQIKIFSSLFSEFFQQRCNFTHFGKIMYILVFAYSATYLERCAGLNSSLLPQGSLCKVLAQALSTTGGSSSRSRSLKKSIQAVDAWLLHIQYLNIIVSLLCILRHLVLSCHLNYYFAILSDSQVWSPLTNILGSFCRCIQEGLALNSCSTPPSPFSCLSGKHTTNLSPSGFLCVKGH